MSQKIELKDCFVQPNGDKVSKAIVLLHGYGSSKDDMQNISNFFNLPNSVVVIPNAPEVCAQYSEGYQWFPLTTGETGKLEMDFSNCKANMLALQGLLQEIMLNYNIKSENIAVFGFSQGGFMALCLAIFLELNLGAVISHSGLFYRYNGYDITILGEFRQSQYPAILLIHGKQDQVLPFIEAEKTLKFFTNSHIKVQTYFKDNLEHTVDKDTLKASFNFIENNLK